MRSWLILISILVLTACATGKPVAKSETEVAAEAAQLIRFSLTNRLIDQLKSYYRNQVSAMFAVQQDITEQVDRIVDEELQQLVESEHQRLLDTLVPIYLRIFTAEEIHQLLSFYQTEVARKSIRVSSQIAAESRQYVRSWRDNFGDELLKRLDTRFKAAGISYK